MRSRENGYFVGSSQSFRRLQGRTGSAGKVRQWHPDCFVRELASVEDRHPKRSPCVSSKAGNQSFDRSNVWRSMLCIENQPGMAKLRFYATRLRTSVSTAPAITPVNRNEYLEAAVGAWFAGTEPPFLLPGV